MIHITQPAGKGLGQPLHTPGAKEQRGIICNFQFASQRLSSPVAQNQHGEDELILTGERPSQEVQENSKLSSCGRIQVGYRGFISS